MEPLLPNLFEKVIKDFYHIFTEVFTAHYELERQQIEIGELAYEAESNYAVFDLILPRHEDQPVDYSVRIELTDKARFAESLTCLGALRDQLRVPCGKGGIELTVRLHRLVSAEPTTAWRDLRHELVRLVRQIGEWTPSKKIEEQSPAQALVGSSV